MSVLTDKVPKKNATYSINLNAKVKALNGNTGTMPIELTIDVPYDPPRLFIGVTEINKFSVG